MFLKLLGLSAIFLTIAAIGMGIRILFKSYGRFPETHISRNEEMRKRGIMCAQHVDTGCNSPEGYPGCVTCSGKGL
jgi:hypothetical protein